MKILQKNTNTLMYIIERILLIYLFGCIGLGLMKAWSPNNIAVTTLHVFWFKDILFWVFHFNLRKVILINSKFEHVHRNWADLHLISTLYSPKEGKVVCLKQKENVIRRWIMFKYHLHIWHFICEGVHKIYLEI